MPVGIGLEMVLKPFRGFLGKQLGRNHTFFQNIVWLLPAMKPNIFNFRLKIMPQEDIPRKKDNALSENISPHYGIPKLLP